MIDQKSKGGKEMSKAPKFQNLKDVWAVCRHPETKADLEKKVKDKSKILSKIIEILSATEDVSTIDFGNFARQIGHNHYWEATSYIDRLAKICKQNGIIWLSDQTKYEVLKDIAEIRKALEDSAKTPDELQEMIGELQNTEKEITIRIKIKKTFHQPGISMKTAENYVKLLGDMSLEGLEQDKEQLRIVGIKIDILERYIACIKPLGQAYFLSLIAK